MEINSITTRANNVRSELAKIKLTKRKVNLDSITTVIDQKKFVESHLEVIKNYEGNSIVALPYIIRLEIFVGKLKK